MSRPLTQDEHRALRVALNARYRLAELVRIRSGAPDMTPEQRALDIILGCLSEGEIRIEEGAA